jgi:hypothetical protein
MAPSAQLAYFDPILTINHTSFHHHSTTIQSIFNTIIQCRYVYDRAAITAHIQRSSARGPVTAPVAGASAGGLVVGW